MTDAITANKLTKDYGQLRALDGLDLSIPQGSVFGLIGPNGAGKTTLMRTLLDIVRPTSGDVVVLGESPHQGGAKLRQRIGYLPGELKVDPRQDGKELLKFWATLGSEPRVAMKEAYRLAESLDVRLGDATRKLSKGNKQKLGVIQAFMHKPELVILDEPTSGLDPLVQQQVLGLCTEARDNGSTVFLSSHVMSEIEQIADTAAVLNKGKLVTVAPMSELRESTARQVQAIVRDSVDDTRAALDRYGLALPVVPMGSGEVAIRGVLEGRQKELVQALAGLDLVSLALTEQDLETRVLDMYGVAGTTAAGKHSKDGAE